MDLQLEKLRDAVKLLQYYFDRSTPKNAREILVKLNSAKDNLKRYKQKNYPELLVQLNHEYIPYVMLDDLKEEFENTKI